MKKHFLLPRWCRAAGLVLLPFATWLFVESLDRFKFSFLDTKRAPSSNMDFRNYNLTDELATAGIIIALCMIAFSKLKQEDEYLTQMRLRSLLVSVYVSYALFLWGTFTSYGLNYLVLLLFNVPTVLVVFILVFNFNLYIKPILSKKAGI
jgi:hypothetical protein